MRKSYRKTYRKMRRVQKGVEAAKRKTPLITLILILAVAAVAIVAAGIIGNYVISRSHEKKQVHTDSSVEMAGGSGLPYIEMLFEDGSVYNRLTGYQSDTFTKAGKGYSLTILPSDLKQRILISEAYDNVKAVSYQVRDLGTGDLIEETTVDDITETGGLTEAVLNIKNLINVRHEYNLQIRLERQTAPALIYNTRIEIVEEPEKLLDAVTFADEIISRSINDEDTDFMEELVETMSTTDSFNYALTDKNSPASLIMWKGLSPKSSERAITSLVKVSRDAAVLTASYPITVDGKGDERERLIVNDMFTISLEAEEERESKTALIDFKRRAYASVSGDSLRVASNSVAFGFQADEDMQRMSSGSGQYVCFVNGGSLWRIYSGTGRESTGFVRIFSFEGDGEGEIRTDLTPIIKPDDEGEIASCDSGFGVNIIAVKDNGDVTFAVYGAFPGGVHTGESGIAVYEFNSEKNALSEVLFVSTSKDMEDMRVFASESYLNDYGEMYVTVDGADNRININDYSREAVTPTAADSRIFYSDDASVMAYSAKAAALTGMSDRIELFDRDEGDIIAISASDGEDLKLLGFIGDDVVYGIAGESDFESGVGGIRNFFKKIIIADKGGNEIKSYGKENEYYTDISVKGGSVEFFAAAKEGDSFVVGESTGIVANNLYEEDSFLLYYESSDERRKELYGSFGNGANDGDDVKIIREYEYNKGNTVVLD